MDSLFTHLPPYCYLSLKPISTQYRPIHFKFYLSAANEMKKKHYIFIHTHTHIRKKKLWCTHAQQTTQIVRHFDQIKCNARWDDDEQEWGMWTRAKYQSESQNRAFFLLLSEYVEPIYAFTTSDMHFRPPWLANHFIAYSLVTTAIVNIANWFVWFCGVLHKI